MGTSTQVSAGLLLFKRQPTLKVFLAHPGGPFWERKDDGVWTIPKGVIEENEATLDAACREFEEETGIKPRGPFHSLGSIQQKSGKTVHAWAWEGDANPKLVTSNTMKIVWPPNSGNWITCPEIDRCAWFTPQVASRKIILAQAVLLDRLSQLLAGQGR
jgi:predicted NUDIX family NTP pyrophosphohydrolase